MKAIMPLLLAESAPELANIGAGPTQIATITKALDGHNPVLFLRESPAQKMLQGLWPAVVLAPGVRISRHLIQRILSPEGIVVIIGSGDCRLDSFKLALHEHGHIGVEPPSNIEVWWGGLSAPRVSAGTDGALPLIVSFYTAGTPYKEEAQRLIDSCNSVGVPHYVCEIPSLGSWEANCALKPSFLLAMWRDKRGPFLWVDADAILHRRPDLLINAACDFAIHKVDLWEFASGTVFFNNTPLAGLLLQRWEALCRCYPHIWDQRLLDAAWEELMREHPLVTQWLPVAYTLIYDRPEAATTKQLPVIVHHQASRRLKSVVSTVLQPSPMPLMNEPWRRARRAARGWLDSAGKPLAIKRVSKPDYVRLPGTPAVIPAEFDRFSRRISVWMRRHGRRDQRIGIFGASWFGVRLAAQLRQQGFEPEVFFDNAPEKNDTILAGIPVRTPASYEESLDLIIVASIEHSRLIESQLQAANSNSLPILLSAHQRRFNRPLKAAP